MNKDILLCGVGGQGTVLASKLIAAAAMREGETVHSAETIGMAQRGGSVTSHIRIGGQAVSPLIPFGSADIILAFEPAEALRNLHYLKKDGIVVTCKNPVKPTTESLSPTGYDGVKEIDYLKDKCNTVVVDGEALCKKVGSAKCLNVILLGALSETGALGIPKTAILAELHAQVKPQFIALNEKAFAAGSESIHETD